MKRRAIILPNGRRVSLASYVMAWRLLKKEAPETRCSGFFYFPESAADILREFRRGLEDRINTRGGLSPHESRAHPAAYAAARTPRVILRRDQFTSLNRSARRNLAHRVAE